jgi:hypothetical protein
MARAVVAGAGLVLALAGCGGGHARRPAVKKPAPAPKFSAILTAPTHRPKANTPWRYTIYVTDLHGRPIAARVRMQVLFSGFPAGQVDNGKTFSFAGTWREPQNSPVIWPPASRGRALTFEALVTARGQTKKLDYAIRVR